MMERAGKAEEMLEDVAGVVAGLVGDVLEVLDKIDLAAGMVGKAELLFKDGYIALGADGLGKLELFVVALAFDGILEPFVQVDAQVLPAAEFAFSKGYFGCRHNLPSGFYRVAFCRRILGRRF